MGHEGVEHRRSAVDVRLGESLDGRSSGSLSAANLRQKERDKPVPAQQTPLTAAQVVHSAPPETPDQNGLAPIHLLCVDKDFDDQTSTQVWSVEVRYALRERFDYYVLQRKTVGGIKFMLRLGTFKTRLEAEQKQDLLTRALHTSVFPRWF